MLWAPEFRAEIESYGLGFILEGFHSRQGIDEALQCNSM